jgi:hypothetical protein
MLSRTAWEKNFCHFLLHPFIPIPCHRVSGPVRMWSSTNPCQFWKHFPMLKHELFPQESPQVHNHGWFGNDLMFLGRWEIFWWFSTLAMNEHYLDCILVSLKKSALSEDSKGQTLTLTHNSKYDQTFSMYMWSNDRFDFSHFRTRPQWMILYFLQLNSRNWVLSSISEIWAILSARWCFRPAAISLFPFHLYLSLLFSELNRSNLLFLFPSQSVT